MTAVVQDCLLWSAEDVTIRFLESLTLGDSEIAEHLLAPDVEYRFGSMIRRTGRSQMSRVLHRLSGRSSRAFDVVIHDLDADDSTVAIRRTDRVVRGPLTVCLRVRGRVEVRDGKITQWFDEFSGGHAASALARGAIGIAVPSMRAHLPAA